MTSSLRCWRSTSCNLAILTLIVCAVCVLVSYGVVGTTSIGAAQQHAPNPLSRRLEVDNEGHEILKDSSAWIYVGELILVIVLSICFERGQDALKEQFKEMGKLGKSLEQMMKSLSKEIMILGFIGLTVYVATKTDAALDIARSVYPPQVELAEDENPLCETFETVHMIIFCVMSCFIFQCGIFMWKALTQCKQWAEWENMRWRGGEDEKTLESLLIEAGLLKKTAKGHEAVPTGKEVLVHENPLRRILLSTEAIEALSWRAIRQNFMFPPDYGTMVDEQVYRLPEAQFFHFNEYLSIKLAEEYTELMEIDASTWVVCSILTFTIPSFMSIDPFWYTMTIAILSWFIVACVFFFGLHIVRCYYMVAPGLPEDPTKVLELFQGSSAAALKSAHHNRIHHEKKGGVTAGLCPPTATAPEVGSAAPKKVGMVSKFRTGAARINTMLSLGRVKRDLPSETGSESSTARTASFSQTGSKGSGGAGGGGGGFGGGSGGSGGDARGDNLTPEAVASDLEQSISRITMEFQGLDERLKRMEAKRAPARLSPVPQAKPLEAMPTNGHEYGSHEKRVSYADKQVDSRVTTVVGSGNSDSEPSPRLHMHAGRSTESGKSGNWMKKSSLSHRFFEIMGDSGLPPFRRQAARRPDVEALKLRSTMASSVKTYRRASVKCESPHRASAKCEGGRPRSASQDSIEASHKSKMLAFRPCYLRVLVNCGFVKLEKSIPNAQEQLFFMEEQGPEYFSSLMQLFLFFQAVVNAMYVVVLCTATLSSWGFLQWLMLFVGLAGVATNTWWLVPYVMSRMVMITNIEMMKDKECVEEVIGDSKKIRIMESIQLLEMAKMEGKLARLVEGNDDGKLSRKSIEYFKERYEKAFSQKKKDDIMKTFQMFDADHSGEVDGDELVAVLSSLGFDSEGILVKSAGTILSMIDRDGNGCLDEDEFKVLMAITLIKESDEQKKKDIKALFERFDTDESGELSIDELAAAFYKLGVPMSEDSMADLVYQVLRRFRQNLGLEDFVHFIEGLEEMAEKE